MKVLYINACARKSSRTARLAGALLNKLGGDREEVFLPEAGLVPVNEEIILKRDAAQRTGDYSDALFSYAKQFAAADAIVIAAPYWDLSFPSSLKVYFENIYVQGIVTRFHADGTQEGLCKAKRLYYVTTAGGKLETKYGYEYVRTLVTECFGVRETELLSAEMLDIDGFDAEEILAAAMRRYGLI